MYSFDFSRCKFRTITISGISVELPYYEIIHGSGPTVLITAGMDGDEYNGIQAAIHLGNIFENDTQWVGTRVIYPLVNIFGYRSGVSWNPLDFVYPKHVYPGKGKGLPSEQIIYELFKYVKHPDIWIDLHGGNRNERLTPFVWAFPARHREQSKKLFTLLSRIKAETVVYSSWEKANLVQQDETLYLLFEAGEKGILDESYVSLLCTWVREALDGTVTHDSLTVYSSLHYYIGKQSGYISIDQNFHTGDVKKEKTISTITYTTGKKEVYLVKTSGRVLWYHDGGWIGAKEIVAVIAEEKKKIIV